MITIRNINEKFGGPELFTAETLAAAVAQMQCAIRDCGGNLATAVVVPADYEIVTNSKVESGRDSR